MAHVLMVRSETHNPWFNLALETLLLEFYSQPAESYPPAILYLWQNEHTVVIGRHQNAWAECSVSLLENEGGRLARRSTGGGAVYHDLGNLNYSLILPRSRYDLDLNFQMILAAVRKVGLTAERSDRNDLLLNGLKFSGNAFSKNQYAGLHHGTVLVNSDYTKIGRYLTTEAAIVKARGVPSVRSRITNLQTFIPDLTVEKMRLALSEAFLERFADGQPMQHLTGSDFTGSRRLELLEKQYASWEWRFGKSLRFDIAADARFAWGQIHCGFTVKQGKVEKLILVSDAADNDFVSLIPDLLTGQPFSCHQLADLLEQTDFEPSGLSFKRQLMARDLAQLLRDQNW